MRVQIYNTGSLGIIKSQDMPSHELPPEAWSDGQNVTFRDGKAVRVLGHDEVFNDLTVAAYWLLEVPYLGSSFWIAAGLTDVECVTGGVVANIGTGFTPTSEGLWNGGILGGVVVMNNGVDIPQYWDAIATTGNLQNLTNWDSQYRCAIMRPFKNFLVAMNITKDITLATEVNYPNRVFVSQPAEPGTLPSTWNFADETKDVVDNQLSDADNGEIIDGLDLSDEFFIYKKGSTWKMQYIGGVFVQKFIPVFDSGAMCLNCVAKLPPDGKGRTRGHFVWTGEDLVVHNGQQMTSVIDGKMRNFIKNNLDANYFYRSFCVANVAKKQMWFCFPETGNHYASLAVTYNLIDGAIGVRSLSNVAYIGTGIIDESGSQQLWDNVATAWDSIGTRVWNSQVLTQFTRGMLAADPVQSKVFRLENTDQFDGVNITSFLERKGITMIGRDRLGQPQLDFTRNKIIQRVWPKLSGGVVSIKVGVQDTIDGAVTWSNPTTFDPATDQYVDPDPPPNGRLPAIRIDSTAQTGFELTGYDIEMDVIGAI